MDITKKDKKTIISSLIKDGKFSLAEKVINITASEEDYEIIKIENQEQLVKLGKGTYWCPAMPEHKRIYDTYMAEPNFSFIFIKNKQTSKRYLYAPTMNLMLDERDVWVDPKSLGINLSSLQ